MRSRPSCPTGSSPASPRRSAIGREWSGISSAAQQPVTVEQADPALVDRFRERDGTVGAWPR